MILVCPPLRSNYDIPDMALAYADVPWPVIDLNHVQDPEAIIEEVRHHHPTFSVQSRSIEWVRHNRFRKSITVEGIDVQCSYAYLRLKLNKHVGRKKVPDYTRFSSFPLFKENWTKGRWAYPLFTSFGCPFKCEFCNAHQTGWGKRSYADLTTEIASQQNVKYYQIQDACFNVFNVHVSEVSQILRGTEWFCTNGCRADQFNVYQAKDMSASGCTTIAFGVEYPNDHVLDKIGKGETMEDIERGIKIAKDYFPSVSVYLISGYGNNQSALDWAADLGVYVHLSKLNTTPFEQIPTMLDSPNKAIVKNRWNILRQYGIKTTARYLKADAHKVWRRAIR